VQFLARLALNPSPTVPVLGITGGIATGKSTVTATLAAAMPGLRVFDADRSARDLTAHDAAVLGAIRAEFGPSVFDADGVLQRPALRAIVFSDPERRKALEAILHPAIHRSWLELAKTAREGNTPLAVDIPLLFETASESNFDKIIVVACSAATQRRRLLQDRNLSPAIAESMIAAQLPLATKIDRADFVVWNDGLPQALDAQVRLLLPRLLPPG
jgi:dephospho-CoA kinase